jgi:hypothetical protein
MDEGASRDLRFGLGLALFGVGGTTVLGFGIAKSTNADLQLWPNPWFIAALVLTILGAVTLIWAWIRTHEKDEPQLSQPVIVIPRRREGFPNWEAGHDVRDGGVLLWMRSTDASELGLVKCRVQEPDGHVHRSFVRIPPPGESSSRGRWEFFYPTEFFEAPTEVWSGRYTVKWTAGGNDTLVVRDEFDVPT